VRVAYPFDPDRQSRSTDYRRSLYSCFTPRPRPSRSYESSQSFGTLHSSNPRRELGAQESGIRRLIGKPPNGGQPNVNRRRSQILLLQEKPISKHYSSIERQAGFRAVPLDELIDGMAVGFLRARRRERIYDRVLRMFEVREPKDCLWLLSFCRLLSSCHTGGLLGRGFSMNRETSHRSSRNAVWDRLRPPGSPDQPAILRAARIAATATFDKSYEVRPLNTTMRIEALLCGRGFAGVACKKPCRLQPEVPP